uniref:Alpha N-terminal protein methyltransferase 1 n=1 Tax=Caligus clemensi TaxID=344056 RepID=C1BZY7_CALCM|nr:Phosphoethanolamine N-methyltransferase [Caligus clemensi]
MENGDSGIDYEKGAKYWEGIDPTIDGMLGGFGKVSNPDLKDSATFLKSLFKGTSEFVGPSNGRVLDCGAGIGRISRNLLSKQFMRVDIVEQCPKFLEKAKVYCESSERIVGFTCSGLQDFTPEENTYDVIWCQWVLGHLTNEDLVQFFRRCKKGLKPNGLIVVKENLTSSGVTEIDKEDGSVTRPEEEFLNIFQKADCQLIKEMNRRLFPKELYPVKMFALKSK